MRSRRRLFLLFFAATLIAASICAAFIFTISEQEHVNLRGSVILRDTYVLSTCSLPNGKFCIWTYDFVSKDFKVRAYRDDLPKFLDGSTSSCIVWAEYRRTPGRTPLAEGEYFVLSDNESEAKPINLDAIAKYAQEIGDSKYFLLQAHNSPTKIFLSFLSADETLPRPLAVFDIQSGKELGRIPGVRTFWPGVCFIGSNHEYLAVSDVDSQRQTIIRVFESQTFNEVVQLNDRLGQYGAELTAVGDYKFLARSLYFNVAECSLKLEGSPEIVVEKEIHYPEEIWKKSAIVGIKNTASTILSGRIPSGWYDQYMYAEGSIYRRGLLAWKVKQPSSLCVARADDPSSCIELPLSDLGGHEWPFQFSEDGSRLITRSAPDSFQILRVALPKISVEQECRLKFDHDSSELTLEHVRPVTAP